ncbi:MAG: hypothetical protein Q8Q09_27585 [Deltaproteobacteria bacterium]|nr:hypothetical protein [Deltaproteobacteria bacterium]
MSSVLAGVVGSLCLCAPARGFGQNVPWTQPPTDRPRADLPLPPRAPESTPTPPNTPPNAPIQSDRPPAFGPLDAQELVVSRPPEATDPAQGATFAMPTARLPYAHDNTLELGSLLGWVAVRRGLHRRVDVGVGLPFALVGLSADVRVALVRERAWALALWGMTQVPIHPGPGATDFLGFTWGGGGPWWAAGPLLSVGGEGGGVHVGVHVGQRALLGGLWGLAHASFDLRVTEGVKLLAQVVVLGELAQEQAARTALRSLLGNSQPRVMPYGLLGARLFGRKSAVDVGLLIIGGERSLLAYGPISVWPWLRASHSF